MSRTPIPLRSLLVTAAALLALLCGRFAIAGATSLEEAIGGTLVPSAAPALLGPITSAGRVGWECKPERAASAASRHMAELPADPSASSP